MPNLLGTRGLAHLDERSIKANGAHYTPSELASFLAEVTFRQADPARAIRVLDPACGDGSLLRAFAHAAPTKVRHRIRLVGYDTDATAAARAQASLGDSGIRNFDIRTEDFLDVVVRDYMRPATAPLFVPQGSSGEQFDVVISNPPYVRTQVLGAKESQRLASLFDLSGRVDLYHAFVKGISLVLRPGGALGLLTSNRFMLTQSGAAVRELLRTQFQLRELYDLGDTRLFSAAVLPAILVATHGASSYSRPCSFTRVYGVKDEGLKAEKPKKIPTVLAALSKSRGGIVQATQGTFQIEQGELDCGDDPRSPWSLASAHTRGLLAAINSRRRYSFGDLAEVRVGIKTTADTIFIRDDWNELPEHLQPEPELLKPLITHHTAARWLGNVATTHRKHVLYPHIEGPSGGKLPVDLGKYPRAKAYLQQHRRALEARRYVIDSGRQWYEIWVPQQPGEWSRRKIVYPDISEEPRFFLDSTGAVVNGDCYWIKLSPKVDPDWAYLLLAVANSTLAIAYYDTVFHNKLYAGRRRFMTQYVCRFPLPDKDLPESHRIIALVSKAMDSKSPAPLTKSAEAEVNELVWSSFGLRKEIGR